MLAVCDFHNGCGRLRKTIFLELRFLSSTFLRLGTLLILVSAPLPRAVQAQGSASAPAVILNGFKAYEVEGARGALAAWLAHSPVAGDSTVRRGILEALSGVENRFGKMVGHEILGTTKVGTYVLRVYSVIRYARGPLYAVFDAYRTEGGWIVANFVVNSQVTALLPPGMLVPRGDTTRRELPQE